MKKLRIVGISQMIVSQNPEDLLVTYSLGSCLGITVYDREKRIGGMIHCALPHHQIAPEKAQQQPTIFVDTGMVCLLRAMLELGASKRNLVCKVAGGASILQTHGHARSVLQIGQRNYEMLQRLLDHNHIPLCGEDVGGNAPRTLFLHLDSGKTVIKTFQQSIEF